MNKQHISQKHKENVEPCLLLGGRPRRSAPMLTALHLTYDVSERIRAIEYGGIGALHLLGQRLGLAEAIDTRVHLFTRHVPYWESDHVLSLCNNVVTGGTCLQDLDELRQDAAYRDAIGAERLPGPTTVGDFLRRFTKEDDLVALQEALKRVRQRVWQQQPVAFRQRAVIDVDGTHVATDGECKEQMDLSHEGIWGYAPLILSLDNTREALYVVNRPGNVVSHQDAVPWIDRAITLAQGTFTEVWLRGDTDFSLTAQFDRWDTQGVRFVFGFDAHPAVVRLAEALPSEAWQVLDRPPAYVVKTRQRKHPKRVKAEVVQKRGFKNIRLVGEEVAAFAYQPGNCRKTYRMVVVRKHLRIEKGELLLKEQIRYFFYITNDRTMSPAHVVAFSNDRGDQENHIAQLKSGVRALRCPQKDFFANWAYMVIATLAWNLKAWYGLLMPDTTLGHQVVRMEFKRFLVTFIRIPCQILRAGRRLIFRVLKVTPYTPAMLAMVMSLKALNTS